MSRAITARMLEQGVEHLWLDATGLEQLRGSGSRPSPRELAKVGLDPATDWLPIAPAAHYSCGGILADLDGATSLPGLWVAGEASCNGVQGANRLASNSLLDGMVFGPRVVEAIDRGVEGPSGDRRHALASSAAAASAAVGSSSRAPADPTSRRGARRPPAHDDGQRRRAALGRVARPRRGRVRRTPSPATASTHGSCATWPRSAASLCAAALAREESRGAHTRVEFDGPDPDPRRPPHRRPLTADLGRVWPDRSPGATDRR